MSVRQTVISQMLRVTYYSEYNKGVSKNILHDTIVEFVYWIIVNIMF